MGINDQLVPQTFFLMHLVLVFCLFLMTYCGFQDLHYAITRWKNVSSLPSCTGIIHDIFFIKKQNLGNSPECPVSPNTNLVKPAPSEPCIAQSSARTHTPKPSVGIW